MERAFGGCGVGEPQEIELYCAAQRYVDEEIVRLTPRRRSPEGKVSTVLEFNGMLGDPQRSFRSIQVAGTSGKGSTSYYLANLLHSHGYRTGLHVSPYLQVATEKSWIAGEYASGREFAWAADEVRSTAEHFRQDEECPASVHGMASLGVTYELFRKAGVEWGVMETGLGGRFDLVQGLDRWVSVITDIGYDHTESLGSTLRDIASHKAGIMRGARVCVAVYNPEIWDVFRTEALECGCQLVPVSVGIPVPDGAAVGGGISLPASWSVPGFHELHGLRSAGAWGEGVSLVGFQARNMEVALRAFRVAGLLAGFDSQPAPCVEALVQSRFPGRMEHLRVGGLTVLLDAAHNEQKMRGLGEALGSMRGEEWVMVLGASGTRDVADMLSSLGAKPSVAVLSKPRLYSKKTAEPWDVARELAPQVGRIVVEEQPEAAMEAAIDLANRFGIGRVLVTGSLYLVGQCRNYFYPWRDVLLARNSFPAVGPTA